MKVRNGSLVLVLAVIAALGCDSSTYKPISVDLGAVQMDVLFVSETYGGQTILGIQDTTFGDLVDVIAVAYGQNGVLDPSFSKDGRKIAFSNIIVATQGGFPFHSNIYIYNMDSLRGVRTESFLVPVTHESFGFDSSGFPLGTVNLRPDWNPVLPEIVYISNRQGRFDIYRTTLTDSLWGDTAFVKLTDATDSIDIFTSPSFSPDGLKILYTSKSSGNEEIWQMNRDGTGKQKLTNLGATIAGRPRYSPSGDKISFFGSSDPVGQDSLHIFIMNPNGTGIQRLTSTKNNIDPAWSPDGNQLVYSKRTSSSRGYIYIIDRDGMNERRLIDRDKRAYYPIWRPNP